MDAQSGAGLTRAQIVAAAVELLDTDGVSGLSMRKLGQRLGSGTTSVYWYVANKDELVAFAVDEVLGEVPVPDESPKDWRTAVAAYVHGIRDVLLRHMWVMSVAGNQPNVGPNSMRLSDRLLALLTAAGFETRESVFAASALTSFAFGSALGEVSWQTMQDHSGLSPAQLIETFSKQYETAADANPVIAQWWRDSQPMDLDAMREDVFEFGLQRQLDGLALLLRR